MKFQTKTIFLISVGLLTLWACSKDQDPPPTDGDDRLTNPYCNDPNAVNYNWGFPGRPDNSICIYPIDTFLGTWLFLDSVFESADSSFFAFQEKLIHFQPTEDTTNQHMAIQGWCPTETLFAVANKYRQAIVDTLLEGTDGQINCADTISGQFNLNTYKKDTMEVRLRVQSAAGSFFHKGWAVKQ